MCINVCRGCGKVFVKRCTNFRFSLSFRDFKLAKKLEEPFFSEGQGQITNPLWQLENKRTRFLPYYNQLSKDADRHLADIKLGLGRSILLRQPLAVLGHWTSQLEIYIQLNGYRFTKEDHILFIKTFYEIISMPRVDLHFADISIAVLATLLQKPRLLTRSDLELDWRSLHRLYHFLKEKKLEEHNLLSVPNDMVSGLENLISKCRVYFSVHSTQEILAEFRPYMCPSDSRFIYAMRCMLMFVTTDVPPEQADQGYKLYVSEFLYWWMNGLDESLELDMLDLLRRLSYETHSYHIDLETYLPFLFTKILRNLELPLTASIAQGLLRNTESMPETYCGNREDVLSRIANVIVNVMGGENIVVQKYIKQLFDVLESFVHPSNVGLTGLTVWQQNILIFLYNLSYSVCRRVHLERYHKPVEWQWQYNTPTQLKLTDKQIDEFVSSVLPCALNGMFAIHEEDNYAIKSLRYLSHLSPKLVVPEVLNRFFLALDAILVPHRLTQTLSSLKYIIVPLVRGDGSCSFRKHVIPLMVSLLPGLDGNHPEKCSLTAHLLTTFFSAVPVVDCSSAINFSKDMTDEETELCAATTVFESFINQFMDKIFSLVDTSTNGDYNAELTDEESSLKNGLYEMSFSLFTNCSQKIYEIIVDRLYNFFVENMFQSRISSEILGDLCLNAILVNPTKTFRRFFSYIYKKLDALISEIDFIDDPNCWEIVWYLRFCGSIFKCDGNILVQEKENIFRLLKLLEPLTPKAVFKAFSEGLLMNLLAMLTDVYIGFQNFRDSNILDVSFDKNLPIRNWAKFYDLKQMSGIQWHIPSESEILFAQEIIQMFIIDQLQKIENPNELSNIEILKALHFIDQSLCGIDNLLPKLAGENIKLFDNCTIDVSSFECVIHVNTVDKFEINGENMRNVIYRKLHDLMEFLLESRLAETRCLTHICLIYSTLIFRATTDTESTRSEFLSSIESFCNETIGERSFIKQTSIHEIMLCHDNRLEVLNKLNFTETHVLLMRDLLKLATSAYKEVREKAITTFERTIENIDQSGRILVDDIISLLKADPSITEDQLYGALQLLVGTEESSAALITQDWPSWCKVWPAIIRAQHSEKQSIIDTLELIRTEIIDSISYFTIKTTTPEQAVEIAKCFWNSSNKFCINPSSPMPNENEINEAVVSEQQRNETNVKKYYELIKVLTELANDKTLHWRHMSMALNFLGKTVRLDFPFPAESVDVFVQCLVNETIEIREQSICILASILKIHRPKIKKVSLHPSELINDEEISNGVVYSTQPWPIKWGFRLDNECLLYQSDKVPRTEMEWNKVIFVENTYTGFYCWPEKIKTYDRAIEIEKVHLEPREIIFYESFTNFDFVQKFCDLMMVEEEEEEEEAGELNTFYVLFFQGLFQTFGDSVLPHFVHKIESIIKRKENLSYQKFAATFVFGIVSGAKFWPFQNHAKLWTWLRPIIRKALDDASTESVPFWWHCVFSVFKDRDPRKLFWLVEILLELASEPIDSPLTAKSRLAYLIAYLLNQKWRSIETAEKFFQIIEPRLAQPYQNLRTALGSALRIIFSNSYANVTLESKQKLPSLIEFFEIIWAKLTILQNEVDSGRTDSLDSELQEERNREILLFKTFVQFLKFHRANHRYNALPINFFRFMPLILYFANDKSDEELKNDCNDLLLMGISQWFLNEHTSKEILELCVKWSKNKLWKSRVSLLKFLQALLFGNLFYYSKPERCETVKNLILSMFSDDRLEVRLTASEVFAGLLHCRFIPTDKSLIKQFNEWTSTGDLITQHAGVLGLAAVVKSCPYTVPDYLPDVLMHLCQHKRFPESIRETVDDTLLDFKRTHQDSWREHKERFTDDQLSVLTDLSISPTYYG